MLFRSVFFFLLSTFPRASRSLCEDLPQDCKGCEDLGEIAQRGLPREVRSERTAEENTELLFGWSTPEEERRRWREQWFEPGIHASDRVRQTTRSAFNGGEVNLVESRDCVFRTGRGRECASGAGSRGGEMPSEISRNAGIAAEQASGRTVSLYSREL